MTQHVVIQLESSPAVTTKKTPASSQAADSELFSAEFDKQVKHHENEKSSPTQSSEKGSKELVEATDKTEQSVEAETTATTDGKNLPTTDEAPDSIVESVDASETVGNVSELPLKLDSESDDDSTVVTTPKTVEVNQHAVDNAQTSAVELVVKESKRVTEASPTSAVAAGVVSKVAGKEDIKVSKNNEAVTAEVAIKVKADGTVKASPDLVTPAIITTLKDNTGKQEVATVRADILQALEKGATKGETEIKPNMRNVLATTTQQQESQSLEQMAKSIAGMVDTAKIERPSAPAPSFANFTAVSTAAPTSAVVASTVSSAQVPSLDIQPAMQSAAWSKVMSSRVLWMAREGVQQAELRLTPANLGPVEVRLHVQNEQVSVTFLAQHSATRDALEQALPRLRDSFNESGIQLANAEVGEQQQQHQQSDMEESTSSLIFTQADVDSDDIDSNDETAHGLEPTSSVGLSLYA